MSLCTALLIVLEKYKALPDNPNAPEVAYQAEPPADAKRVLNYSYWYGRALHQRAPGYMSNYRQQRMSALAALECAQTLRTYWCMSRIYVGLTN